MIASIVDLLKVKNFYQEFINKRIICFTGNDYPFLFFSVLFKRLKQTYNFDVNFLNVNDLEYSDIIAKLDQSFLGNNLFYWLSNIDSHKKSKELIQYLQNYSGPHSIAFFSNDEDYIKLFESKFNCDVITNINQCNNLLFLFDENKHKIIIFFLQNLFKKSSKISLDQFCIFAQYSILLGNRQSSFMQEWADKIIVNEQSFFSLSKFFFAYDLNNFFKVWQEMKDNYPVVFWTTFWSEQIYRAINFINLKEQGKNLQAKQIAYKLPFSFIAQDYKNFSVNQLLTAHDLVYEIDFAAKNNGNEFMLDLFYAKHFAQNLHL